MITLTAISAFLPVSHIPILG